MKVNVCLAKIATSVLSIIDFVLVTVLFACANKKEFPPLIAFLIALSWCCWLYCVFFLQAGLLFSKCAFFIYGYSVLCVLRLAYNVLLVLFLFAGAINAVFSAPTSQAKVLSDVMSTLTGPIFENALASMEIKRLFRLTDDNTGRVIGWMLLVLLCYSMLLAVQLALLLLCAMSNSSGQSTNLTGTSTTTTTTAKAGKKKTGGDTKTALLDV